jgi:hypothetical protein
VRFAEQASFNSSTGLNSQSGYSNQIDRPSEFESVDRDRQQTVNGAFTNVIPFTLFDILTIPRSKSLSDQTSSNCSVIGLVAKDTETTVERPLKTFCSFIISKLKRQIWCVSNSDSQRHRY